MLKLSIKCLDIFSEYFWATQYVPFARLAGPDLCLVPVHRGVVSIVLCPPPRPPTTSKDFSFFSSYDRQPWQVRL